ncbi:GAF domain-containing protein [Halovenus sp. WSH3]|uniref:histidine kinase n=1 Tax=Halovenus carboxidivorans TaxID=2692199 RepID=A0A6B0T161_9EURY|nr:GAF domain-containing sensor histidine kinase [Halovenus carboxidivorans]MXR51655.1 GAF domain-containing protein [Halovenus carboxidivorans]
MTTPDTTDYFRDLYELGADPSIPLDEKIAQAIEVGRDRLDVQYGVLSYTGNGEYEIIDSTITSGEFEAGTTHDLETTWCRHVVEDDEPLAISDAGESEYSTDIAREATGLQCYIGAPIVVDGETYGTLCYSGEQPREEPFGEDERRFVRLLSRWIGYELEREHHHRTLDAQNERLDEFAGVLAHDLRNPLTSARGYVELAAETASEPESEYLETALDSLDRMEQLVAETLSLAREGEDVGQRERVELGAVSRQAWGTVEPANATLVVETDRTLTADRSRLQQLFENLFRNVEEHCGEDVTVTVRGTEDGFIVADDGPGLPEEIAASLFGGELEPNRLGLGLLIIERVVSGHGWEGRVEVDDGTTFVVSGISDGAPAVQPREA